MSDLTAAQRERWEDLKSAQLLFGLSPEEQAELDALSVRVPAADVAALERVVAALDAAWTDPQALPMPDRLRNKILTQAAEELRPKSSVSRPLPPPPIRHLGNYVPWLVAAACLAFAALVTWRSTTEDVPPDFGQQRSTLIATAGDLIRADWAPGPTPIAGASGDVVWSPHKQQGFLRFRGLTANVPTREQYQLWIFDKNQSEQTPIDGGVFDIQPGEEAIVPIHPKLRVRDAYLFAVTIEKPGGVVVSSRERLPLLAKIE